MYNSVHSLSSVPPKNLDRFQNSPTGRAIKAWQAQPPYWAFVPTPLPPQIDFDRSLVSVLSQANRALGELAGLGRTRSSTLLLRLVDGLFDTPMLTIPQAQKLLGITYRSAANNVQKLVNAGVNAGILHEAEATPQGRVFAARDILRAVAETT